jgi:hypothetical protein
MLMPDIALVNGQSLELGGKPDNDAWRSPRDIYVYPLTSLCMHLPRLIHTYDVHVSFTISTLYIGI